MGKIAVTAIFHEMIGLTMLTFKKSELVQFTGSKPMKCKTYLRRVS